MISLINGVGRTGLVHAKKKEGRKEGREGGREEGRKEGRREGKGRKKLDHQITPYTTVK